MAIDTFTGSVKILSASIGQALLEPIALVSIKIQQLAEAFRNLDPHVKQQIGQWALWGTAISGGAMLLGRLTGVVTGLLPLFGALKAALAFTVTNPFGALLAGFAALAVMKPDFLAPVLDSLAKFGEVVASAIGPASGLIEQFFGAMASLAESVLVPALQVVIETATAFVGILQSVGEVLGVTSGQMLAAVAAAMAFSSPLTAAVGALVMLVGALNKIHPALGAVAVAVSVAIVAIRALTVACATNPFTAILSAVGAVVGALAIIGGAYNNAADDVEKAANRITKNIELLKRLEGGGKVTGKEVKGQLSSEEVKEYQKLKTPEEKQKWLEKKAAEAEKEAEKAPTAQEIGKQRTALRGALQSPETAQEAVEAARKQAALLLQHPALQLLPGQSPGEAAKKVFEQKAFEALKGSGMEEKEAWEKAHKLVAPEATEKFVKGEGKLSNDDIEKMLDLPEEKPSNARARAAALKAAAEQGIDLDTGKAPLTKNQLMDREIRKFQQQYPHAFSKENIPQRLGVETVRGAAQNAGLKDPLEALLLQIHRESDQKMEQRWQELQKRLEGIQRGVMPF